MIELIVNVNLSTIRSGFICSVLESQTFRDHGCLFVEFETSKGVLVSSSENSLMAMTKDDGNVNNHDDVNIDGVNR